MQAARALFSTQPPLPGSQPVGCADLELLLPASSGDAAPRRSVLLRLFYPAQRGGGGLEPSAGAGQLPTFLPHPCSAYSSGLARGLRAFSGLAPRPATALGRLLLSLLCRLISLAGSLLAAQASPHAAPAAPPAGGLLPAVVLSHGRLGNRGMYSFLACALASSGRVVAVLEHDDGTASCTPARQGGAAAPEAGFREYTGPGVREVGSPRPRPGGRARAGGRAVRGCPYVRRVRRLSAGPKPGPVASAGEARHRADAVRGAAGGCGPAGGSRCAKIPKILMIFLDTCIFLAAAH